MCIKSILFVFNGMEKELHALNAAFAVAKSYGAQLRILHISPDMPFVGNIHSTADIVAYVEEDNNQRLQQAKEYSAHYAALHNIKLDAQTIPARHASAKFIHRTGILRDIVAQEGRTNDLICIGHNPDDHTIKDDDALIAALFNTGHPVMLIPRTQEVIPMEWKNQVISLAWNGSVESARAIYNAMPFIERAEKVHILIVREHNKKHLVTSEKAILEYMSLHGISSDVIIIDRESHDTAETLLLKAEQLHTDLLVMGTYGHTRFKEMILGGVTDYMLEYSDIPLFLSH